jgi:hypothetical protein
MFDWITSENINFCNPIGQVVLIMIIGAIMSSMRAVQRLGPSVPSPLPSPPLTPPPPLQRGGGYLEKEGKLADFWTEMRKNNVIAHTHNSF